MENEGEWQSATGTKWKSKQKQKQRAYIGNLRNKANLKESLCDLFSKSAIKIVENDIRIVLSKKNDNTPTIISNTPCYALVDCNVETAVKCLNGVHFDGRRLSVQPEKVNLTKNRNNNRNDNRRVGRGGDINKKFGSSGWSKPCGTPTPSSSSFSKFHKDDGEISIAMKTTHGSENEISSANDAALLEAIGEFVSSEMEQYNENRNDNDHDDALNAAISSTAAVMTLLSVNAALDDDAEEDDNDDGAILPKEVNNLISKHDRKSSAGTTTNSTAAMAMKKESDTTCATDFSSRCNLTLSKLMGEYGDYDPDFEKMVLTETTSTGTPTSKSIQHHPTKTKNCTSNQNESYGGETMLAPHGKAPIHVQVVSFGYKYSAPSNGINGWTHSNPLPLFDCRDIERAPHYVAKLSGLSFQVKRALLKQCDNDDAHRMEDEKNNTIESNYKSGHNKLKAKSQEITKRIFQSLKQAINEGDHGYAFPLEMTVYIGSEYGRHRSVVLCETVAQDLRNLLRANVSGTISQPVSVSTRHRDVDQNHKDEEAFGLDLRKEHDLEVKRKKRQEWLDSRW